MRGIAVCAVVGLACGVVAAPAWGQEPQEQQPQQEQQVTYSEVYGEVTAVDVAAGSMTIREVAPPGEEGPTVSVVVNEATEYEGYPNLEAVKVGDVVWVDAVVDVQGVITAEFVSPDTEETDQEVEPGLSVPPLRSE